METLQLAQYSMMSSRDVDMMLAVMQCLDIRFDGRQTDRLLVLPQKGDSTSTYDY